MDRFKTPERNVSFPSFLSGGGEMGKYIRSFDWSATTLGPTDTWPQSLRTTVSTCINSRFPILIWWGQDLVMIYNDAYRHILGNKHPESLGCVGEHVWPEIWNVIGPMLKSVIDEGRATWSENQLLLLSRYGYVEECYFTFSYSPIYDESGGVGGVYCAVTETTENVINQRHLNTLKDLGKSLADCKSESGVYENAELILGQNKHDFPFAILYAFTGDEARLVGVTEEGIHREIPKIVSMSDNNRMVSAMSEMTGSKPGRTIEEIKHGFGNVSTGAWEKFSDSAAIISLIQNGQNSHYGFLVIGLNPYCPLNDRYRGFLQLVADQIATGITNVKAYEAEKKRAEALAEIDHAKTTFFTNISHEFRTPLTLILGSLEELLHKPEREIGTDNMVTLETSHRNAMRLLRLVNNLLDFSRIEAGKTRGQFQLTDISKYTADLAAGFRSLIEKAGLQFHVHCDDIIEAVYIDREMWEKIVLNLLSNAYKYTLQGSITISITSEDNNVSLMVKDTGIGIPEKEIPKMFQRFHRVGQVGGRTYEGTGIGLSLISELVRMLRGTIAVTSKEGLGTQLKVSIPKGRAHLFADQLIENKPEFQAKLYDTFIEETATLFEMVAPGLGQENVARQGNQLKILVVDDNPDMRNYLKDLLEKEYNVITASDGMDGLHKIKSEHPDLVLSDIMMPVMDGIQLVKAVKQDVAISHLPVVLISARAGEDAEIEGYDTGADDYLIKPFSAKQLRARVRSQVKLAQKQKQAEGLLQNLFMQAPAAIAVVEGPHQKYIMANVLYQKLYNRAAPQLIGKTIREVFPEVEGQGIYELFENVYQTGEAFIANEYPAFFQREDGTTMQGYYNFVAQPIRGNDGEVSSIMIHAFEVTEQIEGRRRAELSEQRFKNLVTEATVATSIFTGREMKVSLANEAMITLWGKGNSVIGKTIWEILPETEESFRNVLDNVFTTGKTYWGNEDRADLLINGKIQTRYFNFTSKALRNTNGEIYGILNMAVDVTEQVLTRRKIEESEKQFRDVLIQSPNIFAILSGPEMIITFANQPLLLSWGRTRDIVGKPLLEVLPEIKDQIIPKLLEKVYKTGQAHVGKEESVILTKNGKSEEVYYNNVYQPIYKDDNAIAGITIMATDITEQVASRKRLEESEERFRTLAETLPQLVWVTDKNGKQLYASGRWKEYTGIEPTGEMSWTKIVHPEDLQGITMAWANSKASEVSYRSEARLKYKNGDYRWHFVQGEAIRNEKGAIIKWIGAFTDIHDQKALEEKLEALVAERTFALEQSNNDLQQFAHVASHDLKEPVRKIKTFTSRLQQEWGNSLNETEKIYLAKVQKAADRMSTMIDGVLAYSMINASEKQIGQVDLNNVVEDIRNDLEVIIQEKDADIKSDVLPQIEGAHVLIYQLFYNLINNSLKFAKLNERPSISITSKIIEELDPPIAQIQIVDNGIGFDSKYAERIFKTFTRLNSKDMYEGTGLGLSLCKKIVERHNGAIAAAARTGEGAMFSIRLPLRQTGKFI